MEDDETEMRLLGFKDSSAGLFKWPSTLHSSMRFLLRYTH